MPFVSYVYIFSCLIFQICLIWGISVTRHSFQRKKVHFTGAVVILKSLYMHVFIVFGIYQQIKGGGPEELYIQYITQGILIFTGRKGNLHAVYVQIQSVTPALACFNNIIWQYYGVLWVCNCNFIQKIHTSKIILKMSIKYVPQKRLFCINS